MTSINVTSARPFAKHDWDAFAGAELFPAGWRAAGDGIHTPSEREPLIRGLAEGFVIADGNGIELTFIDTDGGNEVNMSIHEEVAAGGLTWLETYWRFPNQNLAKFFLDALPHTLTIEKAKELGFSKI